MSECPACGNEYVDCRKLTQGAHKHDTNFLRKIQTEAMEGNSYCVEYTAVKRTNGGLGVGCVIYIHRKDFSEGESQ